ncbi:hypothetical protein [Cerasicoccus maritimus]|uniref:hypothetical protein n=1 Tax=Cerasicoccus maritimus TaxID=490089 RepID=UPI002852CFF4|nr:hypothetical protein [Cerasicoccus maritimus]
MTFHTMGFGKKTWTKFDPYGLKTIEDYENDIAGYQQEWAQEYDDLASKRDSYASQSSFNRAKQNLGRKYQKKISQAQSAINTITESAKKHNESAALLAAVYELGDFPQEAVDSALASMVDPRSIDDETAFGQQLIMNSNFSAFNDAVGLFVGTRKKVLVGAIMLNESENNTQWRDRLRELLDQKLDRDSDRELFGLKTRQVNSAQ